MSDFAELHDVTSQEREFIATAVRTSDPEEYHTCVI
jgi:hypothetical protein